MEKKVRITITSKQKIENMEPEIQQFTTLGSLVRYGNKLRVSYVESDLTGMEGVTSAFVLQEERIFLERTGKINARMEFCAGESTDCLYTVGEISAIMTIKTRRVSANVDDNGGEIHLEYGIELEHQFVSLNNIDICIETMA